MGTDYSLACYDCKVFLSCHKWRPHEQAAIALLAAYDPQYYDQSQSSFDVITLDGTYAVPLTADELDAEISEVHADFEYIQQLIPLVQQFALVHRSHHLYMVCDIGDEPWDFYIKNSRWVDWKELPGPCQFHTYLPRILVEEKGYKTWEQARTFLETEHSWLMYEQTADAVEKIRQEFMRLLENCKL